jgi:hypothetical protein
LPSTGSLKVLFPSSRLASAQIYYQTSSPLSTSFLYIILFFCKQSYKRSIQQYIWHYYAHLF